MLERSILLSEHARLEADDVRIEAGQRARPVAEGDHFLPEGMTLDQYEQSILREAIKRSNGNKSQAARLLGLTPQCFALPLGSNGNRVE